ncbi:hypothetical protein D9C73_006028 [Collichthys lucidus]|uniref:Uncharacterized protein n=1 Tax=Collichthys lucidus TaxID=240159 RepID=A0A4U5UF64_COLLU|nr:hypothetical protein D9C73_006028 [Collichthys lucidus]
MASTETPPPSIRQGVRIAPPDGSISVEEVLLAVVYQYLGLDPLRDDPGQNQKSAFKVNNGMQKMLSGFHLLKSYLGSLGNIMEDSRLELIQLNSSGSTTANYILDRGCFDKAIRAHLLVDAANYQHIMKHAFTEEGLGEMRTLMEKVQYYYIVDVIKIFIRTQRLADHNGHLSCIVTRMLDIFAAVGARLYCQLMKQLETLPAYKETFKSFTAHGNHVVYYSSHDWSGTWCDICIEQILMKAAKSEGGLSRGRMRISDSCYRYWVLTLNHFSSVNQRMKEGVKKHGPPNRDLAKTQMKMLKRLNLFSNGLRRSTHLTKIQISTCLCLSQQDSQAQEMTQLMQREQLK